MGKTLLVMAGGTGGHVFPGLAVADLLRERGWKVVWMGNPDSMEAKLVPARGYEMAWVKFGALRGKGLLRKLLLPVALLSGFWQAWREIRRIKPDVVLGMGGYISFPGGMMAVLAGCPLVIHEQNSVAGLANRVLAKVADRIATGFPDVLPKGEWVGNPVRPEIADLPAPAERFASRGEGDPLHLLVLGGSLGAAAINAAVPQGLRLIEAEQRPQVVHQAGEKHLATLQGNYQAAEVHANSVAFIDDMAGAYAWADLVICRSGALTVAELAAAGGGEHPGALPARGGRPPDGQRAFPGFGRRRDSVAAKRYDRRGGQPDPQLHPRSVVANGRTGACAGQAAGCAGRGPDL